MQHISVLHVFDPLRDLSKEGSCLILLKSPCLRIAILGFNCLLRLDLLKKFTALTVLQKYVNVLVVLKRVIKLHDLRTFKLAVDPDFVQSCAFRLLFLKDLLVQYFHRINGSVHS